MNQKNKTWLRTSLTLAVLTMLIACAPKSGFQQQAYGPSSASDAPKKVQFLQFGNSPPQNEETKAAVPEKTTAKDVAAVGIAKPTIYFFPVINEDEDSCPSKQSLMAKNGTALAKICEKSYNACALQGSCAIIRNNRLRSFNISGRVNGIDRFFETTNADCKFGFGVNSTCLDPFYTVAADLKFYKPGDVIYVPALRDIELPNGAKHDGYLIVRDTGRAIKGEGRFDFFSGYYSWRDSKNPFAKIGLGDTKNHIRYYKIKGTTAKAVQSHREFPRLPSHSVGLLPD